MKPITDTWFRATAGLLLTFLMANTCAFAEVARAIDDPGKFAFVHASVIPMDREQVLADQTVLIVDGLIEMIGPSDAVEIPDGVPRIDATDRFLLPAFCDMHTHVLGPAWNMLLPPEDRIPDDEFDMAPFLFPYIANGVTTIQVLSATQDHLGLRERIARSEILGPRLILAQMIDGPDRAWPPPLSTWVASPEEAYQAVIAAKESGYDAMKAYSFLDPASYDAIISAAGDVGMDVIGHIPLSLSVEHVVASGQRLIVHSEEFMKLAHGDFSQERVNQYAETIASSDTWVIPTLVTSHSIVEIFDNPDKAMTRPENKFFQHPMQQGVWAFIIQNLYEPIPDEQRKLIRDGFKQFQVPFTRSLNERGVKLLAGSDTPLPTLVPGFALHRELQELVAAGLSPYQALRSSTTHPFEYLGEIGEAGTVQTGKLANLVLLKENPLVDISNSSKLEGVVIRGRWLSGEMIQEEMEAIASASTTKDMVLQ